VKHLRNVCSLARPLLNPLYKVECAAGERAACGGLSAFMANGILVPFNGSTNGDVQSITTSYSVSATVTGVTSLSTGNKGSTRVSIKSFDSVDADIAIITMPQLSVAGTTYFRSDNTQSTVCLYWEITNYSSSYTSSKSNIVTYTTNGASATLTVPSFRLMITHTTSPIAIYIVVYWTSTASGDRYGGGFTAKTSSNITFNCRLITFA
jgi:hypothetical protein